MKVAINIHPLRSAHKDRGIGFYTDNLIENLEKDQSLEIERFNDLSKIKDADIVHYPWFDLFFHTLPISKKFKMIVTIHDVIPLIFPKHYPVGIRGHVNFFLQKMALRLCRMIITDSEASKADIAKHLKINEDKISAISLAANKNFKIQSDTNLLYIKRKYNLPDRFLLYVGDANWVKNLPFLIEGFRQVSQIPQFKDVKLVLIGGVFLKKVENIDHPELESLKKVNQAVKNFNLDSNILRPGELNLDELVSFYNLATIYVQPSFYEGFGFPILEAFSCGTPVVSSNQGSLPEVGGDAAVYFEPDNIDSFVSILKEILQNKSLQNKLSKLALKQVEKFSWQKAVSRTKEVYLKVLEND